MPIVTKDLTPSELPATVAATVNTYVQPPPTPQLPTSAPSASAQFLEGLSKLVPQVSTALQNFTQDQGADEEAQARLKAMTADPAELRAEIASGNYYGMAHTRAQTALKIMDAQNRVFDLSAQLDGMSQRGELVGPEAHHKVAAMVGEVSADLRDPLAIKKFAQGIYPVMTKFGAQIAHNNVQDAEANKAAELFRYSTGLHDQVDRDAADALPPSPEALQEMHKRALYNTADFAKKNLLMSPAAIEGVLGNLAKHYAATGNVAALNAIGGFDRGGAALRDRYGPQWDAWSKAAEAKQDSDRKKLVNDSVDHLEAAALRANQKPEDFFKAVDAAKAQDPANFPEAKAERLKQVYQHAVASREKQAQVQLSAQQEAAVERDYVEKGAQALASGNGYALPEQHRFTAADGKERTYKRAEYQDQMYVRAGALIDDQAKREGWSQEQTAAQKVRLYGQNGDVHPVYQAGFNDLFNASSAGIAPNPQTLPRATRTVGVHADTGPFAVPQPRGQAKHQARTTQQAGTVVEHLQGGS